MNGLKNMSPEFELIVLSCRDAIHELTKPTAVKGLTALPVAQMVGRAVPSAPLWHQNDFPADCGRIIELCRRHQVGPMVYRGLKHPKINAERPMLRPEARRALATTQGKPTSDDERRTTNNEQRLLSGLKDQYMANVLRNERLGREVPVIAEWFAGAGIRAVPFKGPVMAWQLYGDVALRPCSDLDFILHKDDLASAKNMLEAKGFRSIRTMTEAEDSVWRRAGCGYDMSSPHGEYTVDIAAGATPDYLPYSLSAEEFWRKTGEIEFNGRQLRVMTPELLLIFLCWHGTKHLWERLIWAADVQALLAKEPALDWGKVQRLASESRTSRMVGTGLEVVRRVFAEGEEEGRSVFGVQGEGRNEESREGWTGSDAASLNVKSTPQYSESSCSNTEHTASPGGLRRASRTLNTSVLMCLDRVAGEKTSWLREQLFFLRMWETWWERGWVVLRTMFRPTISDCHAVRFPSWLFGLYYVVRPFRLLLKVVRKAGGA